MIGRIEISADCCTQITRLVRLSSAQAALPSAGSCSLFGRANFYSAGVLAVVREIISCNQMLEANFTLFGTATE
jgi:hypothetical protein